MNEYAQLAATVSIGLDLNFERIDRHADRILTLGCVWHGLVTPDHFCNGA